MATKWKQFNLSDITTISEHKVSHFDGEKDYIATGDIELNKIIGNQRVSYDNRPSRADLIMGENDVLFAKMKDTVKVLVGSKDTSDKIFSTGFYILTPHKDISKEFLYFNFLSDNFNRQKNLLCTGATMSGLNNVGLKKITLQLPVKSDGSPDIDEQKRIVAMLEEAETLKKKRAEADQKMNELIPALFARMFQKLTDKHKEQSFSEVFNITTGKLNANAAKNDGEYPFFTCSRDDFKIDKYAFDCEALLLSGNNATADYSVKYYKGKFNAYQRTYILTLKNSRNSYQLFRYLLGQQLGALKKNSIGTSTKYLTLGIINKLKFIVPDYPSQNVFSEKVKEIEAQKEKQKQSASQLEVLFSSLLSGVFSKKL